MAGQRRKTAREIAQTAHERAEATRAFVITLAVSLVEDGTIPRTRLEAIAESCELVARTEPADNRERWRRIGAIATEVLEVLEKQGTTVPFLAVVREGRDEDPDGQPGD